MYLSFYLYIPLFSLLVCILCGAIPKSVTICYRRQPGILVGSLVLVFFAAKRG